MYIYSPYGRKTAKQNGDLLASTASSLPEADRYTPV